MGDSYSFLTYEDEGTPDNSAGCDGFPFGIDEASTPGTSNPIVVPYKTCFKWYADVQNWSLATDAVFVTSVGPVTDTLNNGALKIAPTNPTREYDLIKVSGSLNTDRRYIPQFTETPGPITGDAGVITIIEGNIIHNAGSYYPMLLASIPLGLVTLKFDPTGMTTPQHIIGHIDLLPINVYWDADNVVAPNTFTMTQFDLTVATTWPY